MLDSLQKTFRMLDSHQYNLWDALFSSINALGSWILLQKPLGSWILLNKIFVMLDSPQKTFGMLDSYQYNLWDALFSSIKPLGC